MKPGTILVAAFVAIVFVAWPILGKYSKASGAWVGSIVMLGTALVTIALYSRQLTSTPFPPAKAIFILLGAAALNGIGVFLYAAKAADPMTPTGIFLVVTSLLGIVACGFLDWAVNGAVPTLRQIGGFAFAAVAIYLMGK